MKLNWIFILLSAVILDKLSTSVIYTIILFSLIVLLTRKKESKSCFEQDIDLLSSEDYTIQL